MKRVLFGTLAALAMIVLPLMLPGTGTLTRGVSIAQAASVPTFAGEVFQQTSLSVNSATSTGCLPPDDGTTPTNSTFNFTATGTASGPVKGTYTETGQLVLGETSGLDSPVNVLSVSGSFTVVASNGSTVATGTVTGLDPNPPSAGVADAGFCVQAQPSVDTEVDLTITTSSTNLTSVAELVVSPASGSPTATNFQVNFQTSTTLSCNTSIDMPFDGNAIPQGDYIWMPAVLDVKGLPKGSSATVNFFGQTVSYAVNGVTTTVPVPNGSLTFSPTATSASTSYNTTTGTWSTVEPASLGAQAFVAGVTVPVPAGGLPGGIKPVTWSGQISGSIHGLTVHWQWGAGVYTSFSTDYNAIQVKPVDGSNSNPYANGDQGGTPETYRSYLTSGARSSGWSATGSCTT